MNVSRHFYSSKVSVCWLIGTKKIDNPAADISASTSSARQFNAQSSPNFDGAGEIVLRNLTGILNDTPSSLIFCLRKAQVIFLNYKSLIITELQVVKEGQLYPCLQPDDDGGSRHECNLINMQPTSDPLTPHRTVSAYSII